MKLKCNVDFKFVRSFSLITAKLINVFNPCKVLFNYKLSHYNSFLFRRLIYTQYFSNIKLNFYKWFNLHSR